MQKSIIFLCCNAFIAPPRNESSGESRFSCSAEKVNDIFNFFLQHFHNFFTISISEIWKQFCRVCKKIEFNGYVMENEMKFRLKWDFRNLCNVTYIIWSYLGCINVPVLKIYFPVETSAYNGKFIHTNCFMPKNFMCLDYAGWTTVGNWKITNIQFEFCAFGICLYKNIVINIMR